MNLFSRYGASLLVPSLLLVCVTGVCGVTRHAFAQESSSLLDDLLSPTPNQGKAAELQEPFGNQVSLKDQLSSIAGQMLSAARLLANSNRAGSESISNALRSQKEAIDALDHLLAKHGASKQNKATQADENSEQQEDGETETSESDQAPSDDSSQQETNNSDPSNSGQTQTTSVNDTARNDSQEMDPSGKTTGQDAKGLPSKETVVDLLKSLDVSGKANWGKLPTRLREQIQNYGALEFVPGYEQQTREYYKFLNEAILKLENQTPK